VTYLTLVAAPCVDLPSLRFRALTPDQVADLRTWWTGAVREALPSSFAIEKDLAARAEAAFHERPANGSDADVCYTVCFDAVMRVIVLVDLDDVSAALIIVVAADCRSNWRMHRTSCEADGISAHERTVSSHWMALDQAADTEAWREQFGDLFCHADDWKIQVVMPGE